MPRERLLELNQQAVEFFTSRYAGSWVAQHLRDRLGDDLAGDGRFRPGYAPASWTALTDHLRGRGASDTEILAAGLGSTARTGAVIDRFRDRLVFPICDGLEVGGFIGRRNPDCPDAGPKYLNTAQTQLFDKGAVLYGLSEGADALAAGAVPVLVEGPLDAIAITLAADGRAVGVAPLGTAFTNRQADLLRPYLGDGKPGVVVATDADPAGQRAAVRAYWQLTARGGNPRQLVMPAGTDPAELLQTAGPQALQLALTDPPTLARYLIGARVADWVDRLHTAEGLVFAVRAAAEIIGALPPTNWLEHIAYLETLLDTLPGRCIWRCSTPGRPGPWTRTAPRGGNWPAAPRRRRSGRRSIPKAPADVRPVSWSASDPDRPCRQRADRVLSRQPPSKSPTPAPLTGGSTSAAALILGSSPAQTGPVWRRRWTARSRLATKCKRTCPGSPSSVHCRNSGPPGRCSIDSSKTVKQLSPLHL